MSPEDRDYIRSRLVVIPPSPIQWTVHVLISNSHCASILRPITRLRLNGQELEIGADKLAKIRFELANALRSVQKFLIR